VRFPNKTVAEEVTDRISRLKGPNKAQRGAMHWIARASASRDKTLQRRSARVAQHMQSSLQKAFPDVDAEFIGFVVADLDSLWDLRQKLDTDLKKLFRMRFPQHRSHLHSFLIDIETRQLEEGSYLIRRLRKRLPKLLKELDRQERAEPRVRGKHPTTAPKLASQADT
jgi:hypothetical protein